MSAPTFGLRIISLVREVFRAEVESVYLFGDDGEYELLAFHYPLIGALPEGEIHISHHRPIPIRAGVVMFDDQNNCTIIIEEKNEQEIVFNTTQDQKD